jgi:hypothetical protein
MARFGPQFSDSLIVFLRRICPASSQGGREMLVYLAKHPEAFDPQTITILVEALDIAWATIQASGTQFDGRDEDAREAIARHIVDLATQGERDRQRLIDGALLRFKL